jgi:ribonuclease E
MTTDERLPAEERGGSTEKPEREYVITIRPDNSDAMPGPDDAEDDDDVDEDDVDDEDEDDAEEEDEEDEEDTNDVNDPAAEPVKPI